MEMPLKRVRVHLSPGGRIFRWRLLAAVQTAIIFALMFFPASTVAGEKDMRSQAIAQEKVISGQERSEVLALLTLDETLSSDRRQEESIRQALPDCNRKVALAVQSMDKARQRLALSRERLGVWLNFWYRYGTVSYLDVLLGAKSWNDFLNRIVFINDLVGSQLSAWRRARQDEDSARKAAAVLQVRENGLRQEELALAQTMSGIVQQENKREALLQSLKEENAGLEQTVLSIESGWLDALSPLASLLSNLSSLPWQNLTPSGVQFTLGGALLRFSDDSLNNVLDSNPAAKDAGIMVSSTPDGIVITGGSRVAFALQARLEVAGPRTVRIVPVGLTLDGLAAQEKTLAALTGGNKLTFDLPDVDPSWQLSGVSTGNGEVDFLFTHQGM